LSTVAAGQVGSTAELAETLDASPELVQAVVVELEQRGLLQRVGDCGEVCSGCPAEVNCGPAVKRSAWMLTTEGRRYLAG
jgi:predicted transcriptional regulator of viral defense system